MLRSLKFQLNFQGCFTVWLSKFICHKPFIFFGLLSFAAAFVYRVNSWYLITFQFVCQHFFSIFLFFFELFAESGSTEPDASNLLVRNSFCASKRLLPIGTVRTAAAYGCFICKIPRPEKSHMIRLSYATTHMIADFSPLPALVNPTFLYALFQYFHMFRLHLGQRHAHTTFSPATKFCCLLCRNWIYFQK